jgi:hypothetical protein
VFRVANDPGPWSAALRGYGPAPIGAAIPKPADRDDKNLKTLMDRLEKETSRARPGLVPIAIAFPQIGPGIFLAAELTPEAQPPAIDMQYRRTIHQSDEKGGL